MEKNESYQEGYQDACEHLESKYIKLEEIVTSIDKFLDKITNLKKIQNYFYNHFKNNKDIKGNKFENKGKRANLNIILKMIEDEKKKEIK